MFGGEKHIEQEYPLLHRSLQNARNAHLQKGLQHDSRTGVVDGAYVCDISNTDALSHTFGAASLTNQAKTLYLRITLFNGDVQVGRNFEFESDTSHNIIGLTTPPQAVPGVLRSVIHATWQPKGTDALCSYVSDAEMYFNETPPVDHIDIQHPVKGTSDHTPTPIPLDNTTAGAAAPENGTDGHRMLEIPAHDEAVINVCYRRKPAGGEVVDYNYPEKRYEKEQEVYLDIRGKVYLKDRQYHSFASASFLLDTQTRGDIYYNSDIYEKHFKAFEESGKHGFSFAFPTDWSNVIPQSVVASSENCVLDGQIQFYCKDEKGGKDPAIYTIKMSSEDDYTPGIVPSFKKLDRIRLLWGCVHEKSKILLAGGSSVEAREVKVGDRVSAGARAGLDALVEQIIEGTEESMWYVKAKALPDVLCVTDSHPVMTKNGSKSPESLTEEDHLLLADGTLSPVEYCFKGRCKCRVINLVLENCRTFCADGYVVGDQTEQGRLAKDMAEGDPDPASPELLAEMEKLKKEFCGGQVSV